MLHRSEAGVGAVVARLAALLPVLVLTSCQSCHLNLSKLVVVEYDHRITFHRYELAKWLPYAGGGEFNELTAKGSWLVFHICGIKNEMSQAEPFHFDLSKFYVVHNDQEFHPVPFGYGDLVDPPLGAADFPAWNEQFDYEIRTAPKQTVIFPGDIEFQNSWRFAIRVDPVIPEGFQPELRYDNSGGEQILLTARDHPPQETLKASAFLLEDECRP